MRLRQICLVAPELQPAIAELREVLGLASGYQDEGVSVWGLENAVMPLGYNFLEVVAPIRPDTAAERYLDRRGGAGGYMVILQVEEGLAHRKRLTEKGIRTVFRADRDPDIWITQYHPSDCGGILLEIDSVNPRYDHLAPDCPWPPAGRNWQDDVRTDVTDHYLAVNLQSEDPGQMAGLWSDLLDHPVFNHESYWQMKLHNAFIRFVHPKDERGPGIESFDVAMNDRDQSLKTAESLGLLTGDHQITACGTRINLMEGGNL